jgi:hypothetical protein
VKDLQAGGIPDCQPEDKKTINFQAKAISCPLTRKDLTLISHVYEKQQV